MVQQNVFLTTLIYRQADVNLRFAGNRTGVGEKCMIMKTVPVQS